MIATLLWTAYLAGTLMLTLVTVTTLAWAVKNKEYVSTEQQVVSVVTCVLWAIWYMYFLH